MNVNKTIIWLLALVLGAILGILGYASLNTTMDIIATVYTRLFQLLAMPTIVLAVVTTMATMGTKGNTGRIFKRTLTYTLLTTISAAVVGAILYVLIAPSNLPQIGETNIGQMLTPEAQQLLPHSGESGWIRHLIGVIPNNLVKPFLEGNVLSLLLIAFAVGIGLSKMPESDQKAIVVKGLLGLQELLFILIRWLIWTLPLGIVAFSAQLSSQVSAGIVADSLGKYVMVILSIPCTNTSEIFRTTKSRIFLDKVFLVAGAIAHCFFVRRTSLYVVKCNSQRANGNRSQKACFLLGKQTSIYPLVEIHISLL